jgi:hypothetical protein
MKDWVAHISIIASHGGQGMIPSRDTAVTQSEQVITIEVQDIAGLRVDKDREGKK